MNHQKSSKPVRQPKSLRNGAKSPEASSLGQQPVKASQNGHSNTKATPRTGGDSTPKELTEVQAKIDVGFGNALFIRGQGEGLSWEKGQQLTCVDATTWNWSVQAADKKVSFKLLLNDQVWAKGEDVTIQAGQRIEVVPSFF